jgi:hypothetical protein
MWQPRAGQWVVIATAAVLLTLTALATRSLTAVMTVIVIDAALIVWALEAPTRSARAAPPSPEPSAIPAVAQTGLRRRSVLLMIVLTVVTVGLYYPIWFWRRRTALNGLNSSTKLRLWPFVTFTTVFAVVLVVEVISDPARPADVIGMVPALILYLTRLAAGLLIIWQCFVIKDILEDHLIGPTDRVLSSLTDERVELSALMTFFFQIYYLQYAINRYVADRRPTSRSTEEAATA